MLVPYSYTTATSFGDISQASASTATVVGVISVDQILPFVTSTVSSYWTLSSASTTRLTRGAGPVVTDEVFLPYSYTTATSYADIPHASTSTATLPGGVISVEQIQPYFTSTVTSYWTESTASTSSFSRGTGRVVTDEVLVPVKFITGTTYYTGAPSTTTIYSSDAPSGTVQVFLPSTDATGATATTPPATAASPSPSAMFFVRVELALDLALKKRQESTPSQQQYFAVGSDNKVFLTNECQSGDLFVVQGWHMTYNGLFSYTTADQVANGSSPLIFGSNSTGRIIETFDVPNSTLQWTNPIFPQKAIWGYNNVTKNVETFFTGSIPNDYTPLNLNIAYTAGSKQNSKIQCET